MLRLLLLSGVIAAVAASCPGDRFDRPGQGNYHGTVTVLNRTEAVVTLSGDGPAVEVPACGEVTLEGAPINYWHVTSPGRDTFSSGGGNEEAHTFLVVSNIVRQVDTRPDPLPRCAGLLQPAN